MPMVITKMKTPKGHDVVRMESSGEVTADDADGMTKTLANPDFADRAILATVVPGAKFSPEARQAFTKSNTPQANAKPVAIVVSSAPLRVLLTFMIRMSGAAATTRFFSNEPEAVTFIDEKLSAQ